jgi:hypothetical protein
MMVTSDRPNAMFVNITKPASIIIIIIIIMLNSTPCRYVGVVEV